MAGKVAQPLKTLAAKPDDISLIPRTHKVVKETPPIVLWPTHTLWPMDPTKSINVTK